VRKLASRCRGTFVRDVRQGLRERSLGRNAERRGSHPKCGSLDSSKRLRVDEAARTRNELGTVAVVDTGSHRSLRPTSHQAVVCVVIGVELQESAPVGGVCPLVAYARADFHELSVGLLEEVLVWRKRRRRLQAGISDRGRYDRAE